MKAFLDRAALPLPAHTVAAAISAGRQHAAAAGRVIIEVKLDGRPLSDEELDSPSDLPLPDSTLELFTADAAALVRSSFADVADHLGQARQDQADAARCLHAGEIQESLGKLQSALTCWEALQQVIRQGPALLRVPLEAIVLPDGAGRQLSILDRVNALAGDLAAIRSALETRDWSALADALDGDLDTAASVWQGLLLAMSERLKPGGPGLATAMSPENPR